MKALLALAAGLLAAASAGAVPTGGTSLAMPRAAHTATLLPSGQVLIAGGCTLDGCETDGRARTTELFDPRRGGTVAGPRMLTRRVGQVAAGLKGGSVLLAGGYTGEGRLPLASAELYDPARRRFVAVGALNERRGGATATRLRDGRVLVVGGSDGDRTLASAELYDPRTRRFEQTGALAEPRAAHAATLLADGRVLVAGGSDDDRVLASAEVYSPRTGRFTGVGRLRLARHKHALVAVAGGALVVGGSDARDFRGRRASAELFDARTDRFIRLVPMREARFKLADAVVRLRSGRVLVAGGGARDEIYDPKRQRFTLITGLGGPFAFATATRLRDGRVLVAGGYDDRIAPTSHARVVAAR